MGNVSKANLQDKDIRSLEIKKNQYRKAVGNPKELYIWVNPSGKKSFSLFYGGKFLKIKDFREGIYSVADARRDAIKLLRKLENGEELQTLKKSNKNYLYKNLFENYITQKRQHGLSEDHIHRTILINQKYILPPFGDRDVKSIKYSEILSVLNTVFNPHNPYTSRLETIHRLINDINNVFAIALKDDYISSNKIKELHKEFPTKRRFYLNNQIDPRYAALTKDETIREFLKDLKQDNKLELQTKRAIYLQILCANRPINTVSAKWADINLETGFWVIQASEMKSKLIHKTVLNSYAIQVLKEQKLFCVYKNGFVFPAINKHGHLHRDTISKAIRNLGAKDKYRGVATSHGFRATFRTICSQNKAELLNLGISEEAIESVLAHKEFNQVKYAYEREKSTMAQIKKLMQWYGDYLNSIEPLF